MSKVLRASGFAALAVVAAAAGWGLTVDSGHGLAVSSALAQKKQKTKPAAKPAPAPATAEFTFDEKINAEIANGKDSKMPVYFAVPEAARAPLPQKFETTDKLIEFKHPEAMSAKGNVGLRIVKASRKDFGKRMAKSGLLQTGDILLTFRPEWGGVGPYPNVQMGVSHAGMAYAKDGAIYQIDNPLDAVHVGAGNFTSEHYRTLSFLHVIRPRGLTDTQRANLAGWATRLQASAKKVYPAHLKFNTDYSAPKYRPGSSPQFVKTLGQIALGQAPAAALDLYCSEFVWSLLAMRDCDPATSAGAFSGSGIPSCVNEPMEPLSAIGNAVGGQSRRSKAGLVDGPLLVIDSMGLSDEQETPILKSVFVDNPGAYIKISSGHRDTAKLFAPKFAELEKYYVGVSGSGRFRRFMTRTFSKTALGSVPENYSPTSYLINTLLPPDNLNRTMDYVATVMFSK